MKSLRLLVILFIGLLFVGGIAAMVVVFTGQHDHEQAVIAAADAGATMQVTASKLTKDFIEDEDTAREKYIGKILLVDGVVAQIGKDQFFLEGHDEKSDLPPRVEVSLSVRPAAKLQKGQRIMIVGTCTGKVSVLVLLEKAKILQ